METPPPAPTPGPALDPGDVLQKILTTLGVPAKVEPVHAGATVLLHISTADPDRFVGKHGQVLSQLQFLLNRILQRRNPDQPQVIIDCDRFREKQRDELLAQVAAAAAKVHRWGDPVVIGPFSPFDRRTIREHFGRNAELEAVTDGPEDGGHKKLIIRLRPHKPGA